MAPQTTLAPYFDSVLTYGHDAVVPQFHSAPFLDTLVAWAPTVYVGTPTAGLVVKAGSTELDGSSGRSFRDEVVGAGSWQITLGNDDPDMPDYDDVVSFVIDGQEVFAGPVVRKNIVTHTPDEGAGEVTALSGLGRLAVTRKGLVRPSRGIGAVPVETTRTWSWVSYDFPDSTWSLAKRIRRADTPTPFTPGSRQIPEWFPDKGAWWVAPNRPDVTTTDAPLGTSIYRWTWTLDDDSDIDIFTGLNNKGIVWFDGARIGDIENAPGSGNRVRIEGVTAGTHVIAAQVTNYIRDTGFIGTVWSVDDDGLLDELVASTDSNNVRSIGYPTRPIGFTTTQIVRLALEEMQDVYGELPGVSCDFTDALYSDGSPSEVVAEVTADVGRSLYEVLLSLADWAADVAMAPGANVLRMWPWGERRSGIASASLVATTDPATSAVEGLSHDGRSTRCNHLLIRYKQGYTTVEDTVSIAANGVMPAYLDLSDVNDETTAQSVGTQLMENRKEPSYGRTLTLSPNSPFPYQDFGLGDYATHDDEAGGTTEGRVLSVSIAEDDTGHLTPVVELNDIHREVDERHENWLQRRALGTLAGGARVTGRAGEPIGSTARVISKDVAEFSFQDPTAGAITANDPAKSSGNLIEFYVEVTTEDGSPSSSSSQVRVYLNGVSLGTVTVPAGDDAAEFDLSAQKVYRNVDRLRAEVISVGGGVNGITVQVRAI